MSQSGLNIRVNEIKKIVPTGTTVSRLLEMEKSGADIFIVNGFPAQENQILQDGDGVVLIKRGEIPGPDELEILMTARHTPGVHQCMKKAVVAIAGLGGLGSAAAVSLARMGVGTLILVDFDVVEPSNLNRQQYFLEHAEDHCHEKNTGGHKSVCENRLP
jgi:sulfur carrier protein ThiS adenylyltransferase